MAIKAVLKIAILLCKIVTVISLSLMFFGGPENRIIKFISKHEKIQAIVVIMILVGTASALHNAVLL